MVELVAFVDAMTEPEDPELDPEWAIFAETATAAAQAIGLPVKV